MKTNWISPVGLFLVTIAGQAAGSQSEIQDHFRRAAEALRKNSPEVAKQELGAVLALDPKNAEAHANRGVVSFVQGNCSNAVADFRDALAVNPGLIKVSAMLGICELRLGDKDGRPRLESLLPKIKEPKLRTQVGMALVSAYEQNGDLERTASVVQSLVDSDPDNVDVLYLAQLVHTELAEDTLNKLAIIAPGSARMQQVIAERLVNAGDLQNAIVHYKKCLEIDPNVPGVRYELAQAILQALPSDPAVQAQAEHELETALKTEGESAKVECELARIALRRSDTEAAYAHYQRAFALNPQEVEAEVGMGRSLMSHGKPQDAVKYLRMAVESDPLNSEAHYRLAAAYRSLNMPDESRKETKLFQEIKQTKKQVRDLYRQMNKNAPNEEEEPDLPK